MSAAGAGGEERCSVAGYAADAACATGYCPSAAGRVAHLAIEGMTCASCALLIQMDLERDPRVSEASVSFGSGSAVVRGRLSQDEIALRVARLDYRASPMDSLAQRQLLIASERERVRKAGQRALVAGLLTVPVMTLGMAMHRSRLLRLLEWALATPIVFWAGWPFFAKAWRLARQRASNMDTLIALGAGSAYAYSVTTLWWRSRHVYFEAAAGIVSVVLLGRYLEERAKGKASEAICRLVELQPQTATLLDASGERQIPVDALRPGDLLLVRPGDRIPTDGLVTGGTSDVDESMVTGESMPLTKRAGGRVVGGCMNGFGLLRVQVTAVGQDTVLSGIVRMVEEAQAGKLPIQRLVDRVSAVFVPGVMTLAGLTFVGWIGRGARLSTAMSNAIAVLLIACPCSLGLATPTAIMVATGRAARHGIYVREGEALEMAARLNVVVFDKTGTLTEGRPRVTDLINVSSQSDDALLACALAVESGSEHFLGRAIAAEARARRLVAPQADGFQALPGRGVRAKVGAERVHLGNREYLRTQGVDTEPLAADAERLAAQGKTPVYMSVHGSAVALFGVADAPRPGARAAVERLYQLGVRTLLATGDIRAAAEHVAAEVGIGEVIAESRPEDKLAVIERLRAQGLRVGMIGDGVNDAPALAAADVGFAVGGGTKIAMEAAHLTIAGGDIERVAQTIALCRRTMTVIHQNLFWAFGYNTLAIPIAASGRLNPMLASAAMAELGFRGRQFAAPQPGSPVTAGLDYSLAFMSGILGSGHCVGMCGALVSGFFIRASQGGIAPMPYVAYHGARIGVYTLVGIIAALAGVALVSTGLLGKLQGLLQIVAGILVILLGLETMGLLRTRLAVGFAPVRWLRQGFARAAKAGTVGGAALGGVVNGMMPCALTLAMAMAMAMAVKATTAPSPLAGGLLMLTFGLGTLPAMLFVTLIFGRLGGTVRGHLLRAAALVVIVMGLSPLYQGISYFNVMRKLGNW